MDITVRLSAGLAQGIGQPRLQLTLAEAATMADLYAWLRDRYPDLAPQIDTAIPVIAGRHVPMTTPLTPNTEVALLLPVSGGL
ncbi:MAG: hypothetical protein KatS3mg050_0151 [Litorilinea sp.]|nr:MAG: hypothetical protein KatS3mg050_0151 [Litorilinea sp.]